MERERLTITLRKDLIPLIDEVIDGTRIRNRSHAIEYLLSQSLGPRIRTAVILAGGRGIQMRPFTYELPKTLIPVQGRPILEHTIELLREYGFHDLIIVVGHLGEKIREHFADGRKFGVRIRYIEEKKENGTAAPLRIVGPLLRRQPFLLVYGDVLIDLNLRDFIDFHRTSGKLATIALTSAADTKEFGVVRLRGTNVVEFLEKSAGGRTTSRLINTGVYVIEPPLLRLIPKSGYSMLEHDVFPKLTKGQQLAGYVFEGQWFDIGTPEIYERALKEWKGRAFG